MAKLPTLEEFKLLPKTKQKKKCDELFSQIIRSAGECTNCQKTNHLQCAHIISRRYLAVRWRLSNALCLCSGCHIYFTHHPLEWDIWIDNRLGIGRYAQLKEEALTYTKPAYEEIYENLLCSTIEI